MYYKFSKILKEGRNNISKTENGLPSNIQKAVKCIQSNIYNEELIIQWLKEQCDIQDKHFSARFQLHLGYYPKEYILYHRIEVSRRLLKQTEATVTMIALAVGFNPSTFCKAFKREEGQSPSNWRNNSTGIE